MLIFKFFFNFIFLNIDLPKYKLEDKEHQPENWSLKSVCCHLQTQSDLEEELRKNPPFP